MEYRIQVFHFNGKKTHRILQNVGGPCPLLGLCNVLLLNNDIRVNQKISFIKFTDLTHCLKDHLHKLFEVNMGSKTDVDETQMANAIKNIEDCVALFPKLEEGLDINIKFSDVTDFEFTSAIAMFDNYNIRLLHGWCVDPQQEELCPIIKDKSYNEVVDFLTSDIDTDLNDAQIAAIEQQKAVVRQFLSDYQQQLTAHGLIRLHETMNENEIAIFFRNNHFSAVYKRQGHIWELVTDEGFVDADPRITWQSLSQLSGDEEFVSNTFTRISQNINQQQQMESYNNIMKQKQKGDQKETHPDGFSIEEQEAYLRKQCDESNTNVVDQNNKNETDKEAQIDKQQMEIEKQKEIERQASDDAMAQRIALEEQLGLESGELERMEREQQEAMKQIQQQQQQTKYNNNNNGMSSNPDPYGAYQQQQIHNNNNRSQPQNAKRKRKKRSRNNKGDDSCVIL
eukprot:116916_1